MVELTRKTVESLTEKQATMDREQQLRMNEIANAISELRTEVRHLQQGAARSDSVLLTGKNGGESLLQAFSRLATDVHDLDKRVVQIDHHIREDRVERHEAQERMRRQLITGLIALATTVVTSTFALLQTLMG